MFWTKKELKNQKYQKKIQKHKGLNSDIAPDELNVLSVCIECLECLEHIRDSKLYNGTGNF